jgi:HD-GYP domain-containing protein (c-di-GMP phosphodiesterase class II)
MSDEVYVRDFMEEYGSIMENPALRERLGTFVESFSRDVDEIVSSLLAEMRVVTSSEGASIYVVDESVLHFAYIQTDGLYEDNPFHNTALDMNSDSICAYVARTMQPVVVGDARDISEDMPFRLNGEYDKVTGGVTVSVITAPIIDYAGNLAGILQLINHRDGEGNISTYEDWMLGYVLLLIENFIPMISGAFDRYRHIFHARRAAHRRSRSETAIEEMFNSIRSQLAVPVSKTPPPWLEGVKVPWSRRDMGREANISKRVTAFTQYINQFDDISTVIEIMLTEARDAVHAGAGIFYTVDGDGADILSVAYVQNDGDFSRGEPRTRYVNYMVKADGSSSAGRAAIAKRALNTPHFNPEEESPESRQLIEGVAGTPFSMLCVPVLDYRGGLLAVFQLINASDIFGNPRFFERADTHYCEILAARAMPFLTRSITTRRLIDAMLRMSHMRDPVETGPHVQRVGAFAAEIYRRWAENRKIKPELIREEEDALRLAAMLHDIGKVAVPDAVLKKPARLTDEEYAIIKTHCARGASMYAMAHSRLEHIAYDITLHHHQRWDGAGYTGDPDVPVLAGDQIPLCARVTAVADVLDALIFPRVYKESWDFDAAIEELVKNSGTQFDPEIVQAACEISGTLRAIAERYEG